MNGSGTPNFLLQLTKGEQARLFEELNYMNLEEIRGFCSARGIPYKIMAEYPNGKVKATTGYRSKADRAGPCPPLPHHM